MLNCLFFAIFLDTIEGGNAGACCGKNGYSGKANTGGGGGGGSTCSGPGRSLIFYIYS